MKLPAAFGTSFRLTKVVTVAAIAVTPTGHAALASKFQIGKITIETPWCPATPGGATVAAGYLTIKNDAASPDRLVSVSADIADRAGIHEMSMADGMMKMRELTEGLPIPAHGSVALYSASYHLMFQGLKRPLNEGESFPVTLNFEKAGTVSVTFEVAGMGATAPDSGPHHKH